MSLAINLIMESTTMVIDAAVIIRALSTSGDVFCDIDNEAAE